MINLIPPHAQKQVKREYWVRVVSVWLFLIGSAFLIVVILAAPIYVLIRSQLQNFLQEYTEAANESQSFNQSEAAIKNANDMAVLLAKADTSVSFSSTIESLQKLMGADVSIDSFTLARKNGALDTITITGIARSRLALSNFKDAIEKDEHFKSATLPLSDLAKDKDISFTMTIEPNAKLTQ